MPQTEDAADFQPGFNFKGTNDSNRVVSRAESMRSGVFGGFPQSGLSSENPSFRGDKSHRVNMQIPLQKQLDNNEKLKKLATQNMSKKKRHKRKETFGGNEITGYNLPNAAAGSSGEKDNEYDKDELGIVSGSDEEEVMHDGGSVQESQVLDQDFEFIDEVLMSYTQEIQNKEAVLEHVKRAMAKGKSKIPEEVQDTTISEVENLEENFSKVIGFACKYIIL